MVYHWHRPLNTMYGDNYRYGTSLYSPGVSDVEKAYRTTLSRTNLRSDRGDLGLYTFAGSHLHGGRPAAGKGTIPTTRYRDHDLYAPIDPTGYHSHYYDHLRATTPERKIRSSPKISSSYTLPDDFDYPLKPSKIGTEYDYPITYPSRFGTEYEYHTKPTKITSDYDGDVKKTVTTKTTTEHWVPLTSYIYNTPYHTYYYKSSPYGSYTYRTADDLYSYNYVDDYKRSFKTTTTTKSKNLDALDLSISSKSYESLNYKQWMEKCHEIQSQLDQVNKWVYDAESKIKTDVVSTRNKIQSELADVTLVIEDTARYNDELQRVIKRQAKQISELNSQYGDMNRSLGDIADILEKSRARCSTLQGDLSSVQSGLEMAMKRRA